MVQDATLKSTATRHLRKTGSGMLFASAGVDLPSWLAILRRYEFKISPMRVPVVIAITLMSLAVSCMKVFENILFGARIRAARVHESPLFILGHWRSGTTLMHELLALDERFTFPTTFTCFNPHCFLLTERLLVPLVSRLIPQSRSQDNMALGSERPQEDEFALAFMGAVSPYTTHLFPNDSSRYMHLYEPAEISTSDNSHWEKTFQHFLKKITVRQNKPIILKSPAHTFRVATLLRLFPKARFVYLVRNPYDVFPSTVHNWKTFAEIASLQIPDFAGLEEHVFEVFIRMHRAFERDRHQIEPGRLYCLRYEDLARDLEGEIKKLYEGLALEGFEQIRPKLRAYAAKTAQHKKNTYALKPEIRSRIAQRWALFISQYGYSDPAEEAALRG
jgi:omega-hydroxy-beta-dihydromenaquinone-9 sulfotransferase